MSAKNLYKKKRFCNPVWLPVYIGVEWNVKVEELARNSQGLLFCDDDNNNGRINTCCKSVMLNGL